MFFHEQPLFYGRVVDFIDFGFHKNWFPVFNVADSAVTIGVTLLVILLMRSKKKAQSQQIENAELAGETGNIIVQNSSDDETRFEEPEAQ